MNPGAKALVTAAALLATAAIVTATLVSAARPDTSALDLPTKPWWGGASYYSAFPKAAASGWDDPTFFPIAVFFGKPADAPRLASLGINTYMGAEHDGSPISTVTDAGVSVLAQPEWSTAEIGDDARVVGWHVSDECDMGLSGCDSPDGESGSLAVQRGYVDALRARDDGRFLQANFGNGVLGSFWSPTTMPQHVALMDVTSVDKYAYTSPHVRDLLSASPFWPAGRETRSASAYGWLQERMASFMDPDAAKPNWVFVETARPMLSEDGASTITPAEIRSAVWSALIHGAAGIAYFQHNNDPACGMYSLLDCSSELADAVAAINAQVQDLAPVLNSPSYVWAAGDGVDAAVKAWQGDAYLFVSADGSGEQEMRLPPGTGGEIEVIGEDRTLRADRDGVFRDEFAGDGTVHLYRVAIGGLR